MKKRDIAKAVLGTTAGLGVATVIGMTGAAVSAINIGLGINSGRITNFLFKAGIFTLGAYAGDKAIEYANKQIDDLGDMYDQARGIGTIYVMKETDPTQPDNSAEKE
jgi:hypothetical protein